MRGVLVPDDPRGRCMQLLHLYDSSSVSWQLGRTKVSVTAFMIPLKANVGRYNLFTIDIKS